MQVAILAGGRGTRLGSLASGIPKALAPVARRAFIYHQLDWLASQGVTDAVICHGYLGEQLEASVGDGAAWGLRIRYSADGPTALGTAGALRLAAQRQLLDPGFITIFGDSLPNVSLDEVVAAHRIAGRPVLMTVLRNDDALVPSNVELAGSRVTGYRKRAEHDPRSPEMCWVDYGVTVLDRDVVLERVPPGEFADLAELLAALCAEGSVEAYEASERFYEIGTPDSLAELDCRLRSESWAQAGR
jgi:NDP-sugar pyrophosphorylase family protein